MLDYDFAKLNDKEFEAFSIALLSEELGMRLERFKPGKDEGVDGRYFASKGGEMIVQCKHWSASGVSALLRHLRSVEKAKVASLKPIRYLMITSLPLSRANKNAIQAIFNPWLTSPADIFGQEDLNDTLARHPKVEETHYKLWFSSVKVWQQLQNLATKGRSAFDLQRARDFAETYAVTPHHAIAIQKLETLGVLVVTGEPGVGKSTLAEQIAVDYARRGFALCSLGDNVTEAENVWRDDEKQLFYFDDFLGRNYLDALQRHEDSRIIGFIRRVRSNSSKRLVLTSRTTVLNRGRILSDLFRIENIHENEYELRIDRLSLLDKGRILYNHIWKSALSNSHVDELFADKRYLYVIKHDNFNPRLVAFVLDSRKVRGISSNEYWQHVQDMLKNPKDVWAHVFETQLTVAARILVRLTVLNGRNIVENELRDAYSRYAKADGSGLGTNEHFESALQLAVGAVLNRTLRSSDESPIVTLFNPSLGDYVIHRYKDSSEELAACLSSLQTESSLELLSSLHREKILSEPCCERVLKALANLLSDKSTPFEFRVVICENISWRVTSMPSLRDSFEEFARFLVREDAEASVRSQVEILRVALMNGVFEPEDHTVWTRVASLIARAEDEEAFASLSELLKECVESPETAFPAFPARYLDFLKDKIDVEVWEAGILDEHVEEYEQSGETSDAYSDVRKFISKKLEEANVQATKERVNEVLEGCDIYDSLRQLSSNWRSRGPATPVIPSASPTEAGDIAAIEDLFDRR